MIIDIEKFITQEKPYWEELEAVLKKMELEGGASSSLEASQRFYYLYQRSSSALVQLNAHSGDGALADYLKNLIRRSYTHIYQPRKRTRPFRPLHWLRNTFPNGFRKQHASFKWALIITMLGVCFGALALHIDPDTKQVLLPFGHLQGDPQTASRKKKPRITKI